jgi:hypothetical protein
MHSRFTPTCFRKSLPSSRGRSYLRIIEISTGWDLNELKLKLLQKLLKAISIKYSTTSSTHLFVVYNDNTKMLGLTIKKLQWVAVKNIHTRSYVACLTGPCASWPKGLEPIYCSILKRYIVVYCYGSPYDRRSALHICYCCVDFLNRILRHNRDAILLVTHTLSKINASDELEDFLFKYDASVGRWQEQCCYTNSEKILRIKGLYMFWALPAHPQEAFTNGTWYITCVLCQLAAPGLELCT